MRGIRSLKLNDKKHSLRGKIGTGLGATALALQIGSMLVIATNDLGDKTFMFGVIGMISLFISLGGLSLSISGFREEETYRTFSVIGTIINICMIAVYTWLFIAGTL